MQVRTLWMRAFLGALMAMVAAPSMAASGYGVVQRIELGGAGKWDLTALDAQRRRLYVSRGDHVDVVDTVLSKKIGEIPGTAGVHGIAFDQERKLGYTSNGKADSITVFDLDTLAVKGQLAVSGSNPDVILYDGGTNAIVTMNGKSRDVSVIDAALGKTVRTIAVPGKPEFAILDGGRLYVNIEDANSLAVVDVVAGKVVQTWKLPNCEEPTGLAFDAANSRLFSACGGNGRMVVVDSRSGAFVANLPIGMGADGAAYDARRKLLFSSNGKDATLTVIAQEDADHYSVSANLPTAKGARTMALEPDTGRIFLPTPNDGNFLVLVVAPGM